MKIKRNESEKKQQQPKKKLSSLYILAVVAIVILLFIFFLWQQKTHNFLTTDTDYNNKIVPNDISTTNPPPPNKTTRKEISIKNYSDNQEPSDLPLTQVEATSTSSPSTTNSNAPATSSTGDIDNTVSPGSTSNSALEGPGGFTKKCSDSTEIIKIFYKHLDTQEYMKSYGLAKDSEEHFTQLIQKLLDNPPVVSGETNDLFTILQNTAHFFRVIGKDNIMILKGILDREKDQFENVLYNFYSIFQTPSCPENSFNLSVSETSLYDYAGFFLNTMGGRLYLFRRDSMSRMVVSYYAILLIDQANKEARNKHGIEIITAIDQLIIEMEANSNQLKFEQLYLDNLYNLKELYQ
jgi:hypothetical protein